jgi:hypothetical protein
MSRARDIADAALFWIPAAVVWPFLHLAGLALLWRCDLRELEEREGRF